MSTKERLLFLLEEHRGTFFSGEEIAAQLSVSRTAIWKAVKALRADGYQIDAVQNKGYRLAPDTDILSEQGLRRCMEEYRLELMTEVLPIAASTNALLKEKANFGAPEGTVVIANAQTQGRGRLGRSFYSPADTGIYMSILLRPADCAPSQAVHITTMAAVAACEAIEKISGRKTEIKWVNDIYMDGRKVCGILTEGAFGLETGCLDYAIVGIGINVYTPAEGFPAELDNIAGAVFETQKSDGKNRLAAAFLSRFMSYYRLGEGYAEKYRERSLVIGKEIDVIANGTHRYATALDIDKECRLIVRYDDGSIEQLSSAEVSIRPL